VPAAWTSPCIGVLLYTTLYIFYDNINNNVVGSDSSRPSPTRVACITDYMTS